MLPDGQPQAVGFTVLALLCGSMTKDIEIGDILLIDVSRGG